MVEAFDLVVSFIEADTGLKLSDELLGKMLDNFSSNKVYEYAAINIYNLPYAFAYLTQPQDIFGCGVDERIASAIDKRCTSFYVYNQRFGRFIKRRQGHRGNLRLQFEGHAASTLKGGSESMIMRIVEVLPEGVGETVSDIYTKTIFLDNARFFNVYKKRQRRMNLAASKLQSPMSSAPVRHLL
ncbi:hypothetical protein E6B08_23215 [Pseudomonas putida]|uniref:Uncharacterized protein n=2 Tax=Pseudomonas putida TaxID=303 RepID=A0A4D6XJH8_PSEPU|nr:hypothetical protein E6B08_23215 [Pseudomonas putida]